MRKSSLASSSVDEYVDACLEQLARHLEVPVGGDGHGGDVHETRELVVGGDGSDGVLGGHAAGPFHIRVADGHEVHVPELGKGQDVILAHVARADHAGPDSTLPLRAHHTRSSLSASSFSVPASRPPRTMPRRDPSMNSTRRATSGCSPSSVLMRALAAPGASPER